MPQSAGAPVRIAGLGVHIPTARHCNDERLADLHIDAAFLERKIGVRTRAVKAPDQKTSDLCVAAFADLAQEVPALDPASVQMVCVVTQNPDARIPHTAAVVQQKLRLPSTCMTFDVSQGCAGYR